MLPMVAVRSHCCSQSVNIENYMRWVGEEVADEIRDLARDLKGLRVCHINATATGGGVAELLSRELPVYRALGIDADWRLIFGDKDFFSITKTFHNALQGAMFHLTPEMRDVYLQRNRLSAEQMGDDYDLYFVHDPQPAALRNFRKAGKARWIWRCHIDSSQPNTEVWAFLRPFIEEYDAAVFTMPQFCPSDLRLDRTYYIPPAIDPVSTKNMELPLEVCRHAVAEMGIDLHQPLLIQVSRFDPWKDPLGVVRAYRLVKQKIPGVQLAMVGAMASDDPEGWVILEQINNEALHDPDLSVFTNLTGVGNMEVNAFQRAADVVIQKSLREGFGLVVTEAFWKGKAVVAGHAGGIPMQFPAGYEQYLVGSAEECAGKILCLLEDPAAAARFGAAGKEHVRTNFLLPRLIRDELRVIKELARR